MFPNKILALYFDTIFRVCFAHVKKSDSMNDSPNREVEVFAEAVDLPLKERAAYLDRACGSDVNLRQRIEALLYANDGAGDFLEQSLQISESKTRPGISVGEKAGDYIGRYKLLQQIGEGGCGVVFMAEQSEPVHRRIALKIIKPGMDTKSVIARFEAERQALALMDHPNIAKVFDAGATESGRPYFVMQLIRGIKITEYCDQHLVPTEGRLKLFVQVCHAVQHAHQKGIIHRDIKPSNILVTTTLEGAAMPMVIDFGIAKATTNQRLTDKTLFTAFDRLVGTPTYMSPEQAALTSVDVDTRTDIYSLGVLLYELLTGLTPFDTEALLKAGLDEILRVIREQDPSSPSTRLSEMAVCDLTKIARHRNSDAPHLVRAICGDLDWIVMKALEKNRTRRYETANGMALDVQRYLASEPILARPPSMLYKLRMTMLRNKILFGGITVIALLLILGLITVSASLAKELRSRRRAEAESIKSQEVTKFLEHMLQGVGPAVARGQDTTMLRGILDQTAESVGDEMSNQPAVEVELRTLIGQLYLEIGNYGQAEKMQEAALRINQKLFGPQSRESADSLSELGLVYTQKGELAKAVAAHQEALAMRRLLFGNENADVAASLNNLGEMLTQQGKFSEAEVQLRESVGIRERLFGSESLETADTLRNLSILLGDQGKWPEAEAMAREVLAIRRKVYGLENPAVATSLTDVAWAAGGNGKLNEAESLELEALAMRRRLLGNEHPDIAKSLYLVGERAREEQNLEEAIPFLNEALAMQRKLLGEDNPTSLDTLHSLGLVYEAQGKLAESEKVHREALAIWRKRGESEIPQALSELESLIHVLMAERKFNDVKELLDGALLPSFVNQPSSSEFLATRAGLEERRGQWQEAADDCELAFRTQPFNYDRYALLAALLVKTHDHAAYEQFSEKILASYPNTTNIFIADEVAKACLFLPPSEKNLPLISHLADMTVTLGEGDEGAMPFFQVCKALSEYRQGHFIEAAGWAQKTVDNPRLDAHGHAYAVLAMADWQLGKKDEARAVLAKGELLAPVDLPAHEAEDPGNAWMAWLFARVSLDEADVLIASDSANHINTVAHNDNAK